MSDKTKSLLCSDPLAERAGHSQALCCSRCAVTFLIDGYNLMHAVGLASRTMPAAQFNRARTRLLDWLADGVKDRAELRVVFDAQHAPTPSLETLHRGVRVRFAFGQTADDLIEELIAFAAKPESLTVVSNDSRVRESGRRAGCVSSTCEEFIDWLLSNNSNNSSSRPHAAEKPEPTPRDVDELLHIFSNPKPKKKTGGGSPDKKKP